MLKLSNHQKLILNKLSGGSHGRWTKINAIKAIHVVYGNKVTFIGFQHNKFHGNNTKTKVRCNLCGQIRCTSLRSILYHPTCPRCHFSGDVSHLSYSIVQERLIRQHRPIIIIPYKNKPYKNRKTHVLAYDYKHDETWDVAVDYILRGRNAPQYSHHMGSLKETYSLKHYINCLHKKLGHNIKIHTIGKYHGNKSIVQITGRKYIWKNTINNFLNHGFVGKHIINPYD